MIEPTSAQELFKGRHFDHEIIVLHQNRIEVLGNRQHLFE
jgi:hypothetical protein